MKRFVIEDGKQWAGNFWQRHRTRVSGLCLQQYRYTWKLAVDMSGVPVGTTIKLCGVAHVSLLRWRRVEYGLQHLLSWTHEDSDRIIASAKPGGRVQLASYVYRNGCGPSTNPDCGSGNWLRPLATVENNEPFGVEMLVHKQGTQFTVNSDRLQGVSDHSHTVGRTRAVPRLAHRTFAHAVSGKRSNSPGRIIIHVMQTVED